MAQRHASRAAPHWSTPGAPGARSGRVHWVTTAWGWTSISVPAGHPPAPARWTVAATLAAGAVLDWRPEPTVVCDDAELHSQVTIALQRGARAVLREEMVLGRAGQRGGRCAGELAVELDGAPLLAHTLLLNGADPVLTGPAGTGGARVLGMRAAPGRESMTHHGASVSSRDCAGHAQRWRVLAGCCSSSMTGSPTSPGCSTRSRTRGVLSHDRDVRA